MIRVTYQARQSLPLDKLVDFQGDAKTITQDNLDKLKRSILKHGFFVPVFVWQKTPTSKAYIIDGHQRLKALQQFQAEGEEVPDVPVEFIDAKSKKDAAEKLLAVTSQFGDFSIDSINAWVETLNIDLPTIDLRLMNEEINLTPLDIDIDHLFVDDDGERTQKDVTVTCPECGHEFIP